MESIRRRLAKNGFDVDEIKKIEKILKEEKRDCNNVPEGEIRIQLTPSRSRLGTTVIAKAIKNALEKANYKVEYKFYDSNCEEYQEFSSIVQKYISNIYKITPFCFEELNNPRANIVISLPETYVEGVTKIFKGD